MRKLIVTLTALAVTAMALPAQESTVKPEIRPFMGMYIPTGDQRDLFDNAAMFGVQAALEFRPTFHLLGTFGWVPGQTKYPGDNDVQILQYDIGVEWDMVRELEKLLRRVADEHVELTVDLARQVDLAQADRAVIGEALIGLTMAAASALPAGGRIQISTATTDIASRSEAPDGVAPGAYAVLKLTASGWGLAAGDAHAAGGPIAPIRQAVERAGGTLVVATTPDSSLEFSVYLALVAELVEV